MLSVEGMVEKWLLGSAESGDCKRVLRAFRGSVYKKREDWGCRLLKNCNQYAHDLETNPSVASGRSTQSECPGALAN